MELPEIWKSPDAKERIDTHLGPGTYDSMRFNPNNLARIALTWTEMEIIGMVSSGLSGYGKLIVQYTKGTRGSDGHPVSYSN